MNQTTLAAIAFVLAVIVGGLGFAWITGVVDSHYQSKYWTERDAAKTEIQDLKTAAAGEKEQSAKFQEQSKAAEERAEKAMLENETLRAINEKQAEILKTADDAEARRAAGEIEKIQSRFERDIADIEATPENGQKCALCSDLRKIGKTLSYCEALCERF